MSPSYQVSACVAWSPDGIDGRNYDIVALAAASDVLYVMDYDTRSQVFDACLAGANAPLPGTQRGLSRYLALGIAPSQLILGVPWYGYRYPCLPGTAADAVYCPIASVPFRGVNCSDAAGSEVGVAEILARLGPSPSGRRWDANQAAPSFNTVEKGVTVQYWYDDVQSLTLKYSLAARLGLRGVGPFTFTDTHDPAMYRALDAFLAPERPPPPERASRPERPAQPAVCPVGTTSVDRFAAEGTMWTACEDLQTPGGGLALRPDAGEPVWLSKSFEPYSQRADEDYYLGLGKQAVLAAKTDMLGEAVLHGCTGRVNPSGLCEPSWARVERAIPVMRYSRGNKQASGNQFMCSPYSPESGVRTFTGSRSASVDATFSDHADDCTDNGFPRPQGYVMNLTAIARGEPPILDFLQYVDFAGMAEGLVGGEAGYPNLVFYFPTLPQNFSGFGGSRYWSMVASPVPDMKGGREQSVWFRFQQVQCAGAARAPPCTLLGRPQYYDTYWFSSNPINSSRWIPPGRGANASGFYANLLAVARFWDAELAAEGMMTLDLPPSPATNGSWLAQQARFSMVRSMISRDDTWHPRYGVLPGYGISLQDGFQDVFTSTTTVALEWGAIPYARGVIDNWITYYMRADGMVTYRAEELAQSGRMLTILALFHSYTADAHFLLRHFDKLRAAAKWLLWRHALSLGWPEHDPRHGIVAGGDEGDTFVGYYETFGEAPLPHMYSCTSNVWRGFDDLGRVWLDVGRTAGRADVTAHGEELLQAAPRLLASLRASLALTSWATGNPKAPRGVPTGATNAPGGPPTGALGDFRGFPELMYSAALSLP